MSTATLENTGQTTVCETATATSGGSRHSYRLARLAGLRPGSFVVGLMDRRDFYAMELRKLRDDRSGCLLSRRVLADGSKFLATAVSLGDAETLSTLVKFYASLPADHPEQTTDGLDSMWVGFRLHRGGLLCCLCWALPGSVVNC